jgi:hypothetical protein
MSGKVFIPSRATGAISMSLFGFWYLCWNLTNDRNRSGRTEYNPHDTCEELCRDPKHYPAANVSVRKKRPIVFQVGLDNSIALERHLTCRFLQGCEFVHDALPKNSSLCQISNKILCQIIRKVTLKFCVSRFWKFADRLSCHSSISMN